MAAQTVVIDVTIKLIDQASQRVNKTKKSVDKLGDSVEKTRKQTEKLGKTKADVKLSAKDKATQVINKVNKSLKNITSKAWNITLKGIDKATAPLKGIINFFKQPLVLGASILGLSMGVQDVIDTFATFEATMSKVQAISGATGDEMETLTEKAKQMGATTKFTASEAGEAFTYMAMAGWKTKEMLGGIEGIMNLAAASGEDLAMVSDIVTDAMTAFGMAADGTTKVVGQNGLTKEVANATHFADVLAAASSNSNTNVALLGESFKYCAPLAGQYKFSIEDTALALGLMANSGIKASNSGTAMRKIFTQLSSDFEVLQADGSKFVVATTNADGSMRSLKAILDDTRKAFNGMSDAEKEAMGADLTNTAKGLGIALENENGELKTQAELYSDVIDATQTMTDAGKVAEAEALAGKTAMAGLLSIIGASGKDYKKLSEAVYNADGAAAKMAAIMLDNLQGDIVLLQSAAEGAKIAFVDKLKPQLRGFVQWVTNKVPDISKAMEGVADYIAEKISNIQATIQNFTSSSEWRKADFFGKVEIAWDKLIAEPFSEWWNSTGKEWAAGAANSIGKGLGSGITYGFLGLLGIDISNIADEGFTVGSSFASGFAEGFDGSKILEGIKEKIKEMFASAFTILPGGKEATAGSWLSAGLLAYGGLKIGKGVLGMANGVRGIGNIVAGSAAPTAMTGASLLGSASAGTGLLGLGANTAIMMGAGNLAGGASLSAGALSALGLSSIAGGVVGGAEVISGLNDLSNGDTGRGVTKIGMVGAGAAAGAGIGAMFGGIGAIPGTLIGAGIGGIGALLKGNEWGDKLHKKFFMTEEEKKAARIEEEITKQKEKQLEIEKNIQNLKDIRSEYNFINDKMYATEQLKNKWEEVNKALKDGSLPEEERLKLQEQMNRIVSELSLLYPDIIDARDVENKKLGETLDIVQDINESEKERQKLLLENNYIEGMKNLGDIKNNLSDAGKEKENLQEQIESFDETYDKLKKYSLKAEELAMRSKTAADEGNDELAKALGQMRIGYIYEIDDIMSDELGYGVEWKRDKNGNSIKNSSSWSNLGSVLGDKKIELNNELIAAGENYDNILAQYRELYDTGLKNIEANSGLGISIEEAAEKYDSLNSKQKKALASAAEKIRELNKELELIPDKKYMDLVVRFYPEEAAGPKRFSGLDMSAITKYEAHAEGGVFSKPHIGLIGEAGTEYLIPTTGTSRHRGIALWTEAGKALGLIKEHARGGIFGKSYIEKQSDSGSNENISVAADIVPDITISVGGMNFTFENSGASDKEGIMGAIREEMPAITNEMASVLANMLKQVFSNMKLNPKT